jgi:hypothetical protein
MKEHTMSSTTLNAGQAGLRSAEAVEPPSGRGWRAAGVAAAVAALVGLGASTTVDAVYADESKNQPDKIANAIFDSAGTVAVFHTAMTLSALLLVVFAVGLRLRLAARLPERAGVLPGVVAGGLGLTAVTLFMGTSLDTEFTQGAEGNVVPEAVTFYGHWINTVSWCWGGVGLAALALAMAALRHGAVARWLGVVSLVLGGLTFAFAVSPLEYMSAMTGAVWLLVASLGLALEKKR